MFNALHGLAYWDQLEGGWSEAVAPDLQICVLPDCITESSPAAGRMVALPLLSGVWDEEALLTCSAGTH